MNGGLHFDGIPRRKRTEATEQEMGYLRRYQFTRAMLKARYGKLGGKQEEATIEDLLLLGRCGRSYPSEKYARAKKRAW
jgi:hypothetical protein